MIKEKKKQNKKKKKKTKKLSHFNKVIIHFKEHKKKKKEFIGISTTSQSCQVHFYELHALFSIVVNVNIASRTGNVISNAGLLCILFFFRLCYIILYCLQPSPNFQF